MFGMKVKGANLSIKGLEALMSDKPEMRKKLIEDIRMLLWDARNEVAADVRAKYGGERESWRSVRNIVFRKVLGGNINMQDMKRGTANWHMIAKKRKVEENPHMRGGNRRRRTIATAKREGYEGKARGFILRFQNEGTGDRAIRYKTSPTGKGGNRGSLTAQRFFEPSAQRHLEEMADKLNEIINREMEKMYSDKTKEKE